MMAAPHESVRIIIIVFYNIMLRGPPFRGKRDSADHTDTRVMILFPPASYYSFHRNAVKLGTWVLRPPFQHKRDTTTPPSFIGFYINAAVISAGHGFCELPFHDSKLLSIIVFSNARLHGGAAKGGVTVVTTLCSIKYQQKRKTKHNRTTNYTKSNVDIIEYDSQDEKR